MHLRMPLRKTRRQVLQDMFTWDEEVQGKPSMQDHDFADFGMMDDKGSLATILPACTQPKLFFTYSRLAAIQDGPFGDGQPDAELAKAADEEIVKDEKVPKTGWPETQKDAAPSALLQPGSRCLEKHIKKLEAMIERFTTTSNLSSQQQKFGPQFVLQHI